MSISADRPGEASGHDAAHPPAPRTGPDDVADPSPAAARLLEMTARETDRWRAEARVEVEGLLTDARAEAARLVRAAREEAEGLVSTAREEAAQETNAARVEAYRMREETSARRQQLDDEIARLEQVETEHRERLRLHLTDLLERVDPTPDDR
ncbi:hypothetical protein ASC77_12290 [Nocardioides sp. Root1257]|uniref:hypothetical protein n=1 Tax=unclassified Nocardioides TaxID=2615069 RepID=UPI0007012CB3|nr:MULTISPECIES: hypothetical protein [unclassified Nocardioides]KQW47259.1 hypothetical protein ASC77_12290 [Nocardioides sp. Root1257]KRC45415.1 hypothetical protein ASE24_12295 [Nocardioides sp. Root224]